jgi:multicomponent Na+:H+ antiporter subunit D
MGPVAMVVPAAVLVVLGSALTLVAGPLYGLTDRAASDLREQIPYIEAVLPGGAP